ncbi:ATP-binding mismatch repair protein, partial [Coemansia erecta]
MQKLPDDAVRLIRSAALVVDIGDIAGLLLDNSLDAGATKFQLNIQLDQFSLAARDNGCGIPESDIRLLGQRYYTSKYAARQRPQAPVTRKPIGY